MEVISIHSGNGSSRYPDEFTGFMTFISISSNCCVVLNKYSPIIEEIFNNMHGLIDNNNIYFNSKLSDFFSLFKISSAIIYKFNEKLNISTDTEFIS